MGKVTGFKEFPRIIVPYRDEEVRINDFDEIFSKGNTDQLKLQGARCMDCGVPFCQSDDGCPVDNLIPEWNDLIYRGEWRAALDRLQATNNFPEFTGRVCPAPCEGACVLGITEPAVTIKNIEQAIVDRGFDEGWVTARPPSKRSGLKVAVVGSGPSGLAAADQLNKLGHSVTVYERADQIGGLLIYGIPNMKLEKKLVDRRVNLLRAEGVEFRVNTSVGSPVEISASHSNAIMTDTGQSVRHISTEDLHRAVDAVVLAIGATVPRDLSIPGREASGIYFAMDYLTRSTKSLIDERVTSINAAGKRVIVIGGGDTGADCIGTALRQGCESVVNFELLNCPPDGRAENNPWPKWPLILRSDYAHSEAKHKFGKDPRSYNLLSKSFLKNESGQLIGVRTIEVDWHQPSKDAPFSEIEGSEQDWKCDLVFLSMGFMGPESTLPDQLDLARDQRSNIVAAAPDYRCGEGSVFAAGDCRRGQSLVVWAIQEGRAVAQSVDDFLKGLTHAKAVA